MTTLGPSGGIGGSSFNDEAYIKPFSTVTEVRIWAGDLVDAVQMILRDQNGNIYELPKHGGKHGNYHSFSLSLGEEIVRIYGRCGKFVDSIKIDTNFNRTLSVGGNGGSIDYSYEGNIVGFIGRAGKYIDAIGVVSQRKINPIYRIYQGIFSLLNQKIN